MTTQEKIIKNKLGVLHMYAELALDNRILKDLLSKKSKVLPA